MFDSGVGGLVSYKELRRLLPRTDLIYLADRKNAPYGTKSKEETVRLVRAVVSRLKSFGCEKILMACCTASSVYGELDEEDKRLCLPIITPSAKIGAHYSRIAVIATERTVKSGVFVREIRNLSPSATCRQKPLPRLVTLVENGLTDGRCDKEGKIYLDALAEEIREFHPDALVLGCTHFAHVEKELQNRLPGVRIINPAVEGARALAGLVHESLYESGKNTYTN